MNSQALLMFKWVLYKHGIVFGDCLRKVVIYSLWFVAERAPHGVHSQANTEIDDEPI